MAQSRPETDEKVLVVTIDHSYAGFFAYVNYVVNQLIYARKHGYRAVVNFGPQSGDGANAFYDPAHGENSWDYYFEPVDGLTYDDVMRRIADPGDPLSGDDVVTLSNEELHYIHIREPDSVYVYPHGCQYYEAIRGNAWYEEQRRKAYPLVKAHIKVKPEILKKVDDFAAAHFAGEHVLGLHLRGTDKGSALSTAHLMRIVRPEEYFPFIDDYLAKHGPCKIFAASDQVQFIESLRARYAERLLSYDALRTAGYRNAFQLREGQNYRKGEDVLIDCLLLSRCDFLLKCTSAVGEFAMYFNPDLRCIDLNLLDVQRSVSPVAWIRWKFRRQFGLYLALWIAYRDRRRAAAGNR